MAINLFRILLHLKIMFIKIEYTEQQHRDHNCLAWPEACRRTALLGSCSSFSHCFISGSLQKSFDLLSKQMPLKKTMIHRQGSCPTDETRRITGKSDMGSEGFDSLWDYDPVKKRKGYRPVLPLIKGTTTRQKAAPLSLSARSLASAAACLSRASARRCLSASRWVGSSGSPYQPILDHRLIDLRQSCGLEVCNYGLRFFQDLR